MTGELPFEAIDFEQALDAQRLIFLDGEVNGFGDAAQSRSASHLHTPCVNTHVAVSPWGGRPATTVQLATIAQLAWAVHSPCRSYKRRRWLDLMNATAALGRHFPQAARNRCQPLCCLFSRGCFALTQTHASMPRRWATI
jgi:hypothetical protein